MTKAPLLRAQGEFYRGRIATRDRMDDEHIIGLDR